MDAKVFRGALSAAIRVTISTALIGCGGNVTSSSGRTATPATTDSADGADEAVSTSLGTGGQVSRPYAATYSGGASTTQPAAAGTTGGGPERGGMTSGTGAAGESASASAAGASGSPGASAEMCGAAADACLTSLEQRPVADAPNDADKACCDILLPELERLRVAQAECYPSVERRFMAFAVRPKCCTDPSTWQQTACAPWGPPVPPELSLAALGERDAWS